MAKSSARIYIVTEYDDIADTDGISETLVLAKSQAQAISHLVQGRFKVAPASALDVADMMTDGKTVVDATAEELEPE